MRTMTETQARNYIKAGYFPTPDDTVAITDLQDVFGHQTFYFNLSLISDDDYEIRENALELFNLIESKSDVELLKHRAGEDEDAAIEIFNHIENAIIKARNSVIKNYKEGSIIYNRLQAIKESIKELNGYLS